jgi:hypothetical protein
MVGEEVEMKRVKFKTIQKNTTLGQFVKKEVVDRTKDVAKLTFDLVMKMTKKR